MQYSTRERSVSGNRQISLMIGVLGLLVVAISMVGLINAITMSVFERTREIGVLRCIGARGRDIRRIFAAEGLTVAVSGWLLGLPLGYGLARLFNWLVLKIVGIEFAFVFPPLNALFALVGTIALGVADHAHPAQTRRPAQAGRCDPLFVSRQASCRRRGRGDGSARLARNRSGGRPIAANAYCSYARACARGSNPAEVPTTLVAIVIAVGPGRGVGEAQFVVLGRPHESRRSRSGARTILRIIASGTTVA